MERSPCQEAPESVLEKELRALCKHPIPGIACAPLDGDNWFAWNLVIVSPAASDERFLLVGSMEFPPDYPNGPPTVKFRSRIRHPNVSEADGKVSLPILDSWSASHTAEHVLVHILAMLTTPMSNNSPAEREVAVPTGRKTEEPPQALEIEEPPQAPEIEETPQAPEIEETLQAPKTEEPPQAPKTEEPPQASEAKKKSKRGWSILLKILKVVVESLLSAVFGETIDCIKAAVKG